MDHDIFHLGIVDGALRCAAPCVLRGRIAVVDTDNVDGVHVELEAARIFDPAAEHEVKLAHTGSLAELRAASAFGIARGVERGIGRRLGGIDDAFEQVAERSSPLSRLSPSLSRRCDPVSSRGIECRPGRVLHATRRRPDRALLGFGPRKSAAMSAPAARPPASATSGASPSVSVARSRAAS